MNDFNNLGLAQPLLQALAKEGYTTPTPIQAQAIPHIMAHRDVLGIAQTGTGKTAAFALPLLHHLATHKVAPPRRGARILVLSPTRELASQIAQSFRTYGARLNLSVAVVFGGVSHAPQIRALERGLDVLVATPGRLLDHIESRRCNLGQTEVLVLDEVDQMLDLGFIRPIQQIVSGMPAKRQNLFFSATMPKEIRRLADELLNDPVQVSVTPVATTVERVQQQVIFVEAARKRNVLVDLFADPAMSRTIVFTRTKRGADKVAQHLLSAGISAEAIHGNKSQGQRERSLASFRAGRARAMVATDIAARGIDIDGVSHVINFELPEVPEAYVHRIGRTARAGAAGIAISLCDGGERGLLRDIERLTRLPIDSTDRRANPSAPYVQEAGDERRQGRGQNRNGGRPSGNGRANGNDRPHGNNNGRPQRSRRYGKAAPHRGQSNNAQRIAANNAL